MNVLVWLAAILLILMILIGGKKRCAIFYFFILQLWCNHAYHIFHDGPACKSDYFNFDCVYVDQLYQSFFHK